MAEYIDKEKLLNALDDRCNIACQYSKKQRQVMCSACPLGDAFDVIDEFPNADVVEVVRCKDCKYWFNAPTADDFNSCEQDALIRHKDFFCACGERRSE